MMKKLILTLSGILLATHITSVCYAAGDVPATYPRTYRDHPNKTTPLNAAALNNEVNRSRRFVIAEDKDSTSPPITCDSSHNGWTYLLNSSGTGGWASFSTNDILICTYQDGSASWLNVTPKEGYFAYLTDEDVLYYFDGTSWSGTGTGVPSSIAITDNESTNECDLIPFIADEEATGPVSLESDGDICYNPSLGSIAVDIVGDVTGNVTGNVTGDLTGDVTGNADTCTTLATARYIAGNSFDGSANVHLGVQDGSTATVINLSDTRLTFFTNTSDGADTGYIYLAGGAVAHGDRGAYINLFGNENANAGDINLISGSASGANVTLRNTSSNGNIIFYTGGATTALTIDSSQDATFAGDVSAVTYSGAGVSTSIPTPGVDTKVASEQAVREAISALTATATFQDANLNGDDVYVFAHNLNSTIVHLTVQDPNGALVIVGADCLTSANSCNLDFSSISPITAGNWQVRGSL